MKITYIDQTGKLGGGEIALLPWLQHRSEGARVVLFTDGPFHAAIKQINIPVDILEIDSVGSVRRESSVLSVFSELPALWGLRKHLRERLAAADLLYANSQKAFLLAVLARHRSQPLIWHLRDIMTSEHFKPILRWVAVFMGNRFADAIICNSQATAAAYLAAGGRPGKVTVVYDGVSPDPFDAAAKDTEFKQNLRSELAVPPGAPLIGLFGRLSEWKGQHILLEALAALPEAHGMLVGDALFGEQDYVQRLRERADRPDLAGRIHFLGFRHDIPELMVSTDVVVHTSTAPEPLGLVIVEGLLARRPVIATAGGGAMEVIIDGESGILVRPGEPAALLNALRLLLADPVMAERLSAAGRNRAESLFSVKAVISGIGDVVDRFGRP